MSDNIDKIFCSNFLFSVKATSKVRRLKNLPVFDVTPNKARTLSLLTGNVSSLDERKHFKQDWSILIRKHFNVELFSEKIPGRVKILQFLKKYQLPETPFYINKVTNVVNGVVKNVKIARSTAVSLVIF